LRVPDTGVTDITSEGDITAEFYNGSSQFVNTTRLEIKVSQKSSFLQHIGQQIYSWFPPGDEGLCGNRYDVSMDRIAAVE
jgi:hypothetical protein